ncbi:MAG: GNAT family N-acetyltransferase [Lyngbya sp.]|nr:GNAT family N-acetyltransferase [Lyngbya sp.]
MKIAETKRLIIREFEREDFQELAPILAHPQVMKFSSAGVLSISATQAKIQNFIKSYEIYGFGKWAVIFKDNNQLIGYCGIAIETIDNQDEPEIGYRLAPQFWGQGLATEAASAAINYAFEQYSLPDILGIVERENTASVRVLEKLGMHYQRKTLFLGIEMDIYCLDNPKKFKSFIGL